MSEDWISAREASEVMWPGKRPSPVPNAITKAAEAGLVQAWAVLQTRQGREGLVEVPSCLIPKEFWGGRAMIPDWEHGVFTAMVQQNGHEEEWKVFGVRFEPSQIVAMAPSSAVAGDSQRSASTDTLSPTSVTKNLGGRPPYDWEGVMIEMARQLYVGDLHPKTQADIEKAISAYIPDRDSKSESTVREHARRLWQAIRSEAGK